MLLFGWFGWLYGHADDEARVAADILVHGGGGVAFDARAEERDAAGAAIEAVLDRFRPSEFKCSNGC